LPPRFALTAGLLAWPQDSRREPVVPAIGDADGVRLALMQQRLNAFILALRLIAPRGGSR
jgi:hypothetical protein